ncbi:MAG TPA: hypothetical protein PLA72_10005 [Smithellaceae bacterium]|nr:hypothetical protein [Smithellaceae bacterium]
MDSEKLQKLSLCDSDRRRMLARYYASISEEDRLQAHALAGQFIKSMRSDAAKMDEYFFHATLLRALNQMHSERKKVLNRKAVLTDAQAAEIAQKRLSSFLSQKKDTTQKKRRKKAQLVSIRYFELIKTLRSRGLSWRNCSEYLEKNHGKKVSHQYLKTIFEKNAAKEEVNNA